MSSVLAVLVKNINIVMGTKLDVEHFDDIRPYNDEECLPVVNRLLQNNQLFFRIAKMAFPRLSRISPSWAALLSRWLILNRIRQVKDIASFQIRVTGWFFFRMLDKTTDGIKHQWLDKPAKDKGHLFLSNHRDIAVDPAVVSHSLFLLDEPLPLVGIGDNLLSNTYASDVMKLNQCFIVRRTFTSSKDMLAAMRKLSQFISYSIERTNNVWLAHREGRAKDSRDRTSPAVIKMLKLNSHKDKSWAQALNPLNIRTVSISYQYDPCVIYKAHSLLAGKKSKTMGGDSADLAELVQGVVGNKGMVNVVIGKENIWNEEASLEEITSALDHQIISNYKLYNSHFYGLEKLVQLGLEEEGTLRLALDVFKPATTECKVLENSLTEKLGKDIYTTCLRIYANPILEKLALIENSELQNKSI